MAYRQIAVGGVATIDMPADRTWRDAAQAANANIHLSAANLRGQVTSVSVPDIAYNEEEVSTGFGTTEIIPYDIQRMEGSITLQSNYGALYAAIGVDGAVIRYFVRERTAGIGIPTPIGSYSAYLMQGRIRSVQLQGNDIGSRNLVEVTMDVGIYAQAAVLPNGTNWNAYPMVYVRATPSTASVEPADYRGGNVIGITGDDPSSLTMAQFQNGAGGVPQGAFNVQTGRVARAAGGTS